MEEKHGVFVEWCYWHGKAEVLGEKHAPVQFVHHKSHMDLTGIEPESPRWEVGDWPLEPWEWIIDGVINVIKDPFRTAL
jgi:hypothetical protein